MALIIFVSLSVCFKWYLTTKGRLLLDATMLYDRSSTKS